MLPTHRRAAWILLLVSVIGYELIVEAVTTLVPILGNAIFVYLGLRFLANRVHTRPKDRER